MSTGNTFEGGRNGDEALREKVASYVAEQGYEEGVQSLEAAFRAARAERVRQLEEGGYSKEEAVARANEEEEEAYERAKRTRDDG